MISALLSFGLGLVKYTIIAGTVIVIAGVGTAIYSKPNEESGRKFVKARRAKKSENIVQALAAKVINSRDLQIKDWVVCRVAEDDQGKYIGVFGSWYELAGK